MYGMKFWQYQPNYPEIMKYAPFGALNGRLPGLS